MLTFPQLEAGAIAQLPLRQERKRRWVKNVNDSGILVAREDTGAARQRWELSFRGLSEVERARMENFYLECRGRLRSFRFAPPGANLLRWSENLAGVGWVRTGVEALEANQMDPLGGTGAWRLTAGEGGNGTLEQTVSLSAGYWLAASVYVRAESLVEMKLSIRGSGNLLEKRIAAGPQWRRQMVAGRPGGGGETVSVAVELEAGTTVELFGVQLEAQRTASAYKRTDAASGMVETARFGLDELPVVGAGPGNYDVRMVVEALESEG